MSAASKLIVEDGTIQITVPSCAMFSGGTGQGETNTGNGVIEYADGSARRWVRFQARALTINGQGPAPHGLWGLDLTVDTWTVQVISFENDNTLETWTVVPARPTDNRQLNSGRTSWSLTLRDALPR